MALCPRYPVRLSDPSAPAPALEVPDLLLMAASRAEIFISNSEKHDEEQVYVLQDVKNLLWAAIIGRKSKLARIRVQGEPQRQNHWRSL